MNKYGPTRGELWFRLVVSVFGLGLLAFALAYRGIGGIAWVEIALIAGGFFGAGVVLSARRLWRGDGK